MKNTFFIEVTDTFCGETNYCWIHRYEVKAKSMRGAMRVVGNHEGLAFRFDGDMYHAVNACIAAYDCDENCEMPEDQRSRYVALN